MPFENRSRQCLALLFMRFSVATLGSVCSVPARAAPCESLARVSLSNAKITTPQVVAPGAFTLPGVNTEGIPAAERFCELPSFCRVMATLTPSSLSGPKSHKASRRGNESGWRAVIVGQGLKRVEKNRLSLVRTLD